MSVFVAKSLTPVSKFEAISWLFLPEGEVKLMKSETKKEDILLLTVRSRFDIINNQ
jgi:hypothetical protein